MWALSIIAWVVLWAWLDPEGSGRWYARFRAAAADKAIAIEAKKREQK